MVTALMRCAVLLGALGFSVTSAAAEYRIQRDYGGQIGPYLYKFAQVRESGQRVVIDGPCLSACTLALAVMPRERICMTPNAVLGFHAAWMPELRGAPGHEPGGHAPPHGGLPAQDQNLDQAARRPERKDDFPARPRVEFPLSDLHLRVLGGHWPA